MEFKEKERLELIYRWAIAGKKAQNTPRHMFNALDTIQKLVSADDKFLRDNKELVTSIDVTK